MPGRTAFTVSDEALMVINTVEYVTTSKGDGVRIQNPSLERKLYEEVNACLTRAGFKWDKGVKAHLVAGSARMQSARQVIASIVDTGKAPQANPDSYFATPVGIVNGYFLPHMDPLPAGAVVLEPSCGTGDLLCAIRDHVRQEQTDVTFLGFEIDKDRYIAARERLGDAVVWADFMTALPLPTEMADLIVMNPPFSKPGDQFQWLTHVQHAMRWLKPGGKLISVVPASLKFHSDRRVEEFRAFLRMCGGWTDLPEDAFKASGTGVNTCVLWLERK